MRRVIVAGSRHFNNYNYVSGVLDALIQEDDIIINGLAPGVDTLALWKSNKRGQKLEKFPADWDKYGRAAGPIRNEKMAKVATHLIAFWNGKSKGTKSMIDLAKKYNLDIKIIYYDKIKSKTS